jgi:predicted amidophosphoribosyltransferase
MGMINKDEGFITKTFQLQEIFPDLAAQIGAQYGLKTDEMTYVVKGLIPSDLQFIEGEHASVDYITTKELDRDGEIVEPEGLDFTYYINHPVVLWVHDYKSLPLGRCAWIKNTPKGTVAKTIYAKHPFAQQVYEYRRDGFPLAKSIGFVPLSFQDYDPRKSGGLKRKYDRSLLIEYSDVPVPSNPGALQIAVSKGLLSKERVKEFLTMSKKEEIEIDFDLGNRYSKDVVEKRTFTEAERQAQADKGNAMPDGSYPIANVSDLKNAIQSFGRAKDPEAVKRHIINRARALGKVDLLPESWNVSKKMDDPTDKAAPATVQCERCGAKVQPDQEGMCPECKKPVKKSVEEKELEEKAAVASTDCASCGKKVKPDEQGLCPECKKPVKKEASGANETTPSEGGFVVCPTCKEKLQFDGTETTKCPKCKKPVKKDGTFAEQKSEEREVDLPTSLEIQFRDSSQYDKLKRFTLKEDAPRVFIIYGYKKEADAWEAQALRFPKSDNWTAENARKWFSSNADVRKSVVKGDADTEEKGVDTANHPSVMDITVAVQRAIEYFVEESEADGGDNTWMDEGSEDESKEDSASATITGSPTPQGVYVSDLYPFKYPDGNCVFRIAEAGEEVDIYQVAYTYDPDTGEAVITGTPQSVDEGYIAGKSFIDFAQDFLVSKEADTNVDIDELETDLAFAKNKLMFYAEEVDRLKAIEVEYLELKVGRVISDKNRKLIETCISALQDMLALAENKPTQKEVAEEVVVEKTVKEDDDGPETIEFDGFNRIGLKSMLEKIVKEKMPQINFDDIAKIAAARVTGRVT